MMKTIPRITTAFVIGFFLIVYSITCFVLKWDVRVEEKRDSYDIMAKDKPLKKGKTKTPHTLPTIAYGFAAYKGDMYSIPAVIAAVFDPENVYYVQLDAQVTSKEVVELEDLIVKQVLDWNNGGSTDHGCSNEECVRSRLVVAAYEFSVAYEGISESLAVIDLMQKLLEWDSEWDFFINLTPLDYPLGTQKDIRKFLKGSENHSFIGYSDAGAKHYPKGMFFDRWHDIFVDPTLWYIKDNDSLEKYDNHGLVKIRGARIPDKYADTEMMMVMQSEARFILQRSFCDFVVASPLSRRVGALLAHSSWSSEKYMSTVMYNSKKFSHCPSNMRGNTKTNDGPPVMNKDGSRCVACSIGDTGTPEEDTVAQLAQTGLLFYRKFPQLWGSEGVSPDLVEQYVNESYRTTLRKKMRDESSKYTQTWRLAVKEKMERLLPQCQVANPFLSFLNMPDE